MPTPDRPFHRRRRTATLTVGVLVGVAALSACGSSDEESSAGAAEAEASATVADFGLVSPDVAATLATDDSITVVDVRTPDEFDEGHIDGALLIDATDPSFADRIEELDPADTYLVYCRSGNRSAQAVAAMAEIGIDRVYELDGGVVAYTTAGHTLTT